AALDVALVAVTERSAPEHRMNPDGHDIAARNLRHASTIEDASNLGGLPPPTHPHHDAPNDTTPTNKSAEPPPPLRGRVTAWFASLDVGERSRILTFEDRAWCALAANMAARLDRRAFPGQKVRFEVQPPALGGARASFHATTIDRASHHHDPSAPPPPGRVLAAETAIENAALAYGNPPAAVTFAEAFLRDSGAFFTAMDVVSGGRYLRNDEAEEGSANSSAGAAKAGAAGFRQQRSSGSSTSSWGGKMATPHGGRKTGGAGFFPAGGEGSLKGLAR
ncbi:unnamed protein product, partial [Ectocarpus fasciculatus]